MKNKSLIVGLGNPGTEYENTRHNVGFMFLDYMVDRKIISKFNYSDKFFCYISKYIENNDFIFVKPMTFMNNSGLVVSSLASYYKISSDGIFIVHDDLDLKLGKFKISKNKNASGHNGVLDIFRHVKTKDLTRIRIGIDNRTKQQKQNQSGASYVLSRFKKDEILVLKEVFESVLKSTNNLLDIVN